jgi:hypothetical protein
MSIAAGGTTTGRVTFGPFAAGDTVIGLHVAGIYPTAVTEFLLRAGVFTHSSVGIGEAEFEAGADDLFGPDNSNVRQVALPPGSGIFLPLDLRFDRTSWLTVQAENPSAAEDLSVTVGVERAIEEIAGDA